MNPTQVTQRHETYWNLHKNVFSVRVKGRVIQHVKAASIRNVTFAVQPAGRTKVLLEKRKNVHAFVRGDWMQHFDDINVSIIEDLDGYERVIYNPYLAGTFVSCSTGDAIYEADRACFVIRDNKPEIYAWNLNDKEL